VLLKTKLNRCHQYLNEVFYGMTIHAMSLELKKRQGSFEQIVYAHDLRRYCWVACAAAYYSMRLLPHIIPFHKTWRRNILREKDLLILFQWTFNSQNTGNQTLVWTRNPLVEVNNVSLQVAQ